MSHNDKRSPHTDALETLGTIIGPSEKRDAIHLAVYPAVAGEYLKVGEHVQLFETDGKAYGVDPGAEADCGIVDPFLTQNVRKGEHFWLVVLPRTIRSLRHVWEHPSFPASTETGEDISIQAVANRAYVEAVVSSTTPVVRWNRTPCANAAVQRFVDKLEDESPMATEAGYNRRVEACNEAYAWIENYADSLSGEYDDHYYTITAGELIETAATHLPDENGNERGWGGEYIVKGGLLEGVSTRVEFWDKFEVLTGKRPGNGSTDRWMNSPSFFSCGC